MTNADATISFEGEVRKNDKLDQFGFGKLVKYFADELNAKPIRQPTIWVRLEVGPIEFTGYMVITALTPADGGTNDLVTFTVEFKVANSNTVKVEQVSPEVPVASVIVTPATSTGAVGSTVQLTANVLPADATIKTGAWTSSDATKATVSSTGLVTRVAVGTATMTFTTTDGAKTGTSAITVTA
ncbi:Ig domain-containing protein [Rahnella sp. NRRL B-41462]|uniref:Ig-like domain-containing protein n=1 Tax=Rahnella sp. NRRL B-41462 TaxID=1610579 RepID=UPI00351A33A8